MAFFACNYDNVLFSSDYYHANLQTIEPDDTLYIVDTNDWVVEKITGKKLKEIWSDDLDFRNIAYDTDKDELYFVENDVDFLDCANCSDSEFCLTDKDYRISFSTNGTRITTMGVVHTISYRRWDYRGNNDLSEDFDNDSWYISIAIDDRNIGIIEGGFCCEGYEFGVSYAFRTKHYFIVRMVSLMDEEPVAITLAFRGSELVDIYSSGANAGAFILQNFSPSDTLFQTKSKVKGEPY